MVHVHPIRAYGEARMQERAWLKRLLSGTCCTFLSADQAGLRSLISFLHLNMLLFVQAIGLEIAFVSIKNKSGRPIPVFNHVKPLMYLSPHFL